MIPRCVVLGLVLITATACTAQSSTPRAPSPSVSTSISPLAYVQRGLAIMDQGIYAGTPQWRQARAQALREAATVHRVQATYPILADAVLVAGGPHSHFFTPEEMAQLNAQFSPGSSFTPPTVEVHDRVGTIVLPSYLSVGTAADATYVSDGASKIIADQRKATCGWVVDVQDNYGGDQWPMLAAVSPLLSNGTDMRLRDRYGKQTPIMIDAGTIREGAEAQITAKDVPTRKKRTPIAVIQGPGTASAAEWVVAALHAQPGVTTVGDPTAGFSSNNERGALGDGAYVRITTAVIGDRTGHFYGGPIPAQQPLSPKSHSENDTRAAAAQWLRSRCPLT